MLDIIKDVLWYCWIGLAITYGVLVILFVLYILILIATCEAKMYIYKRKHNNVNNDKV